MAMNVGGSGGPKSDINITPLVDVVLVLLIIFMVITPILQMGYAVQVRRRWRPPRPCRQDEPDDRAHGRAKAGSTSTRR